MSVQAISWVLEDAPNLKPHLLGVLIGLANHADRDGRGSYPSQATIAKYARKADRNVRRDLAQLEADGLIHRGDQRLVEHYPADERPIVWNLSMARTPVSGPNDEGTGRVRPAPKRRDRIQTSARTRTTARTPTANGPDVCDRGGSDTGVRQTVLRTVREPNEKTSSPRRAPSQAQDAPATRHTKSSTTKPGAKRATRLPEDFLVTPEMAAWAKTHVPDLAGMGETDKFLDYYRSAPGSRGLKTDWVAAWRNWMRKAKDDMERFGGRKTNGNRFEDKKPPNYFRSSRTTNPYIGNELAP